VWVRLNLDTVVGEEPERLPHPHTGPVRLQCPAVLPGDILGPVLLEVVVLLSEVLDAEVLLGDAELPPPPGPVDQSLAERAEDLREGIHDHGRGRDPEGQIDDYRTLRDLFRGHVVASIPYGRRPGCGERTGLRVRRRYGCRRTTAARGTPHPAPSRGGHRRSREASARSTPPRECGRSPRRQIGRAHV